MRDGRSRITYCVCVTIAVGVGCASSRPPPQPDRDVVVLHDTPLTTGDVLLAVPKGWRLEEVAPIGFEGSSYVVGSAGDRCAGSIVVDFYGGYGNVACGPEETNSSPGTLFGAPVTWRTGEIATRCGKMLWSRALIPGTSGGGVRIVAPTARDLADLTRLVSGMAVRGGSPFEPKTPPDGERWSFQPDLCQHER